MENSFNKPILQRLTAYVLLVFLAVLPIADAFHTHTIEHAVEHSSLSRQHDKAYHSADHCLICDFSSHSRIFQGSLTVSGKITFELPSVLIIYPSRERNTSGGYLSLPGNKGPPQMA